MTIRLSSRGIVAIWPDFLKKQATRVFYALRDLLSFGGGDSSGNSQTADCILVSGSYRQIQLSSPVSTSQVNFEQPSLNFRDKNPHHSTLARRYSSFNEWGDPPCASFSDTKMIVQYGLGRCRFDAKAFLNLSSGNSWFDLD